MDAAFMSFQRGWGIPVVSAEPERAKDGITSHWGTATYDQQKLSGIAFIRRGRGGSQGVAENGRAARNRCAAGSAEEASGSKIH